MRRALSAGAAAGVVAAGLVLATRRWQLGWGATGDELGAALPGDELIAAPDLAATRAITVRAPAGRVWPWIAQLGQGRGGLYSYDFLENLAGCDMHSADQVVADWQDVAPGDAFRLHPDVALEVAAVDAGRSLVVRGGIPIAGKPSPFAFTWAFVLWERPDGTTRLLVRERWACERPGARLLVEPVELAALVMTRKMLRGIRDRAELAA